jgi:hypothetical protein
VAKGKDDTDTRLSEMHLAYASSTGSPAGHAAPVCVTPYFTKVIAAAVNSRQLQVSKNFSHLGKVAKEERWAGLSTAGLKTATPRQFPRLLLQVPGRACAETCADM